MRLDIKIPTTSVSSTDKPFTIYTIRIQQEVRVTTVCKRYNDFVQLHADVTKQAGGAKPPVALPGKAWFSRTIKNPSMTEQRRRGLEAYLRGIEDNDAPDGGPWRLTSAWRAFLQLGSQASSTARPTSASLSIRDSATWLQVHCELHRNLQYARMALTRREQAQTLHQQHEAGAATKKYLVVAGLHITALDDGLDMLSGGGKGRARFAGNHDDDSDGEDINDGGYHTLPAEKLGEGELRRRRDLLSSARKQRDALESMLGLLVARSLAGGDAPAPSSPSLSTGAAASSMEKLHLFNASNGSAGTKPRRTLGAAAPVETTRTRELDNVGLAQLQRQMIQEQDEDVADLGKVVRRMREIGVQINDELQLQTDMLRMMDEDVDRVGAKVALAKRNIHKIR